MRIHRTIPPVASVMESSDLLHAFTALLKGRGALEGLERSMRRHFGVRHVFLLSSGKAAFTLLLRALRRIRPERDEVVIPAYTCYSRSFPAT